MRFIFLFSYMFPLLFCQFTGQTPAISEQGANCKVNSTKRYSIEHGLCSRSVYINDDNTFCMEFGCEGKSHFVIGSWEVSGDSILLVPTKKEQVDLICSISFSKSNTDTSKCIFIIKDKIGEFVPGFTILPVNQDWNMDNPAMWEQFAASYDRAPFSVNFSTIDSLEFTQLKQFPGMNNKLATKNLPDTVTVTLKTNGEIFVYSELKYADLKPFKVKMGKKSLYDKDEVLLLNE